MQKSIILVIVLFVALAFAQFGFAQSASPNGLSSLTLSSTKASVYPGNSVTPNFTLNFVSGTAGPTFIIIGGSSNLSAAGVNIGFNPGSGTPTYSGVFTINVNGTTKPGLYNITIETGGADPANHTTTFALTVLGNSTSITNVTTAETSLTTILPPPTPTVTTIAASIAPTTTAPAGTSSGSNNLDLEIGAVVVVIIIIVAILALMGKKGK